MNATYTCNGSTYPATILAGKNQLSIQLNSNAQQGAVIWQYYNMQLSDRSGFFVYNDYPPQTLEVLDAGLAAVVEKAINSGKGNITRQRFGPLAKILIIGISILVLMYALVVPWLSGVLAGRFPQRYERQLGDQIYNSMKQGFTIDRQATVRANRFFKALRFPATNPIQITVVKGDVTNAFALPGGHIIVYDRLLRGVDDYEVFAALLAHEYVHIVERHTVRTIFRQMGSAIFLSLLIGDAGAISATILNNANELKNLSYSRRLEAAADREGVQLLTQRNIDCGGFVRLFQLLQKQSRGEQPSEWLSSHPDLQKRIAAVRKLQDCRGKATAKNPELHTLFLQLKTAE